MGCGASVGAGAGDTYRPARGLVAPPVSGLRVGLVAHGAHLRPTTVVARGPLAARVRDGRFGLKVTVPYPAVFRGVAIPWGKQRMGGTMQFKSKKLGRTSEIEWFVDDVYDGGDPKATSFLLDNEEALILEAHDSVTILMDFSGGSSDMASHLSSVVPDDEGVGGGGGSGWISGWALGTMGPGMGRIIDSECEGDGSPMRIKCEPLRGAPIFQSSMGAQWWGPISAIYLEEADTATLRSISSFHKSSSSSGNPELSRKDSMNERKREERSRRRGHSKRRLSRRNLDISATSVSSEGSLQSAPTDTGPANRRPRRTSSSKLKRPESDLGLGSRSRKKKDAVLVGPPRKLGDGPSGPPQSLARAATAAKLDVAALPKVPEEESSKHGRSPAVHDKSPEKHHHHHDHHHHHPKKEIQEEKKGEEEPVAQHTPEQQTLGGRRKSRPSLAPRSREDIRAEFEQRSLERRKKRDEARRKRAEEAEERRRQLREAMGHSQSSLSLSPPPEERISPTRTTPEKSLPRSKSKVDILKERMAERRRRAAERS